MQMRSAHETDPHHDDASAASTPSQRDLARLRWALRIVGSAWVVFWSALLVNELSDSALWDAQSWIAPFLMWGHGGREYLVMLAADNVVIGAFMVLSAARPLSHRLFIDFVLLANLAHMASMIVMALMDVHEHSKLLGDIPLGTVPTLVLGGLWLRARRSLGGRDGDAARRAELSPLARQA
jgi:hypothetical protein